MINPVWLFPKCSFPFTCELQHVSPGNIFILLRLKTTIFYDISYWGMDILNDTIMNCNSHTQRKIAFADAKSHINKLNIAPSFNELAFPKDDPRARLSSFYWSYSFADRPRFFKVSLFQCSSYIAIHFGLIFNCKLYSFREQFFLNSHFVWLVQVET